MIGDEGWVWFEGEIEKNFRKQEIGSMLRIDETGVFADPADARSLGKIAFEDWTCVCVPAVLYRTPTCSSMN